VEHANARRKNRTLPLVALVLVLALPAAEAATRLLTEISNGTANERTPMAGFDTPGTAVADFDGDGLVEIVGHNENRVVYVMASDRPHVFAEIHPPYPQGWGARALSDPAVGDVDNDGRLEIVVVTSAAHTCVYEYDPHESTVEDFDFDGRWCRRADRYEGSLASADGGPYLADVNRDGRKEILMQTEHRGLFVWNHDGSLRWSKGEFGGNAGPLASDLNNDGRLEAL
jgi:hypothetical protein